MHWCDSLICFSMEVYCMDEKVISSWLYKKCLLLMRLAENERTDFQQTYSLNKCIQIENRSKEIIALNLCPELGFTAVSSSADFCPSWNWLATVILSSLSFSFCQIGKRVGTSLELEWWLMTRLLWCTLPCWRTATLFSTNWANLQTPLPEYVRSGS